LGNVEQNRIGADSFDPFKKLGPMKMVVFGNDDTDLVIVERLLDLFSQFTRCDEHGESEGHHN
jgi:hypothetical protein